MALQLPTPDNFSLFPFVPPYPVQVELMRHIYTSIEEEKLSIVESPTGTGKTLSLLSSALTWLSEEKKRASNGVLTAFVADNGREPEWVQAQTLQRHKRQLETDERAYEERLQRARQKEAVLRKMARAHVHKKPKASSVAAEVDGFEDDIFLPEDDSTQAEDDNLSPAVRALMKKLERATDSNQDPDSSPTCTKVYYASRTHSQLSQVISELQKLKIEPTVLRFETEAAPKVDSIPAKTRKADSDEPERIGGQTCGPFHRTVSLGSRKLLCINERLKARSSDLDEACREMLDGKHGDRCSYLPPTDEPWQMLDFKDQILASPKDIEDLATLGQLAHVCPYFGSRGAIPQAELVTLPYNLLLQKTTREALGIDLQGQIVIIDEAHNLIPTLLSLGTINLPYRSLCISLSQLSVYYAKFRKRLSATHVLHMKRLITLLNALKAYVGEWKSSDACTREGTEVMGVGELVRVLGRKIEGVNLMEIESYLRSSKIARKINGYSEKLAQKAGESKHGISPPLRTVEAFILALTSANEDGRIILSLDSNRDDVEIKYQQLNPSVHFRDIIESARSVILAGGTMSPISDVINQLFPYVPKDKLTTFSCGHVIPSSNLQTLVLTKGSGGSNFEFKFEQRGNKALIAELGQTLLNLINPISGGVVVFLPSYSFLETVESVWNEKGILAKLDAKKKLFFEPRDNADVDTVLQNYSREIYNADRTNTGRKPGALLLAVIGAKLSEGLNFSDDLARAVIVIGLPFANMRSPELKERLKYVRELQSKGGPSKSASGDAGIELYENMCMNAVNQSIGRAVRHKGDWASLILIDSRYASARIRHKLPKWIGETVVVTESFGQAMKNVGAFFREKRALATA